MLERSVRFLKGVGEKRARALEKAGIYTLKDLLDYFPSKYQDRRNLKSIRDLKEGQTCLLRAKVLSFERRRLRRLIIFQALIQDETGSIVGVWFGNRHLERIIKKGKFYYFYGKVERFKGRLQIINPEFEEDLEDKGAPVLKLAPVYRLPLSLSQRKMREWVLYILDNYSIFLEEFLSFNIRREAGLENIVSSYRNIHFPRDWQALERAQKRFIFEEFFLMQVLVFLRRAKFRNLAGKRFVHTEGIKESLEDFFKIKLTSSQEKVLAEIIEDTSCGRLLRRLLQGEVGSGKTMVATGAMLLCCQNNYQSAFMVPTEILAWQHYAKLKDFFSSKGFKMELFTSSTLRKSSQKLRDGLLSGKIHIAVGTHSLLDESLKFKNLGLVVIDEQHRFGVMQRLSLLEKGGYPHTLVMTATPIPRTLSMTLYGDLDTSFLKELPGGFKRARTFLFYKGQDKEIFSQVKRMLEGGSQIYFVFPLIEDSEALDLQSATEEFSKIKDVFAKYKVELLHGRVPSGQAQRILEDFRNQKIHILVCTQVVEVGVDVKNARCMVINDAHRFGLSQLHQLRGRIQRSPQESLCMVVCPRNIPELARRRIKAFVDFNDGFLLSEQDLKIRGPGDFLGTRQHGLPQFKVAQPLRDLKVLKRARELAYGTVKSDPKLELKHNLLLRKEIEKRYKGCAWFQVD